MSILFISTRLMAIFIQCTYIVHCTVKCLYLFFYFGLNKLLGLLARLYYKVNISTGLDTISQTVCL